MALLSRIKQLIFGIDGPTSEFGVIGSDANGSPTNTKNLATMQTLSQYNDGLFAIAPNADEPPCAEDINSIYYLLTSQLAYLFQEGIPEWETNTDYYIGSIVQVAGVIYVSISGVDPTPNQGNTPVSSPTHWATKSIIITGNTTLTVNPSNQIVNVQTGSSDVTITFPAAVAVNRGFKIVVHKQDAGTGRAIITGDINHGDIYLRSEEVAIFEAAEVTTGVYTWVVIKERNLSNDVYQEESPLSVLRKTDLLFEFGSPSLAGSDGRIPLSVYGYFVDKNHADALFTNRGSFKIPDDGGHIKIPYDWENEGYLAFWFKPDWPYNTSAFRTILTNFNGSGSDNDSVFFRYLNGTNKFRLTFKDDASNSIQIDSAVYTSDVQLQVKQAHVITWNKTTNTVNWYINGVSQGTPVVTGAGITNIDLTGRTVLCFGIEDLTYIDKTHTAPCTVNGLLIDTTYSTSTVNYNNPGTDKPLFFDNQARGIDNLISLDSHGNHAAENFSCYSINNGGGFEQSARVPIGIWDMNATGQVTITLTNFFAHINNDLLSITGLDAFIINDGLTTVRKIEGSGNPATQLGGYIYCAASGNDLLVNFIRTPGGFFQSTSYDDTTINRGWATIKYIVQ